jgi:acyl-CoA oxidase
LQSVGQDLSGQLNRGIKQEDAWNEHLVDFVDLARFHFTIVALELLQATYQKSHDPELSALCVDDEFRPLFKQLVRLFSLDMLQREQQHFFRLGYFTSQYATVIQDTFYQQCKVLRRHVIPLVDAFGFPDFILKAPIGRYDGDIYPHYFNTVKNAPNCFGPPPYFEKYIKPLTGAKDAQN